MLSFVRRKLTVEVLVIWSLKYSMDIKQAWLAPLWALTIQMTTKRKVQAFLVYIILALLNLLQLRRWFHLENQKHQGREISHSPGINIQIHRIIAWASRALIVRFQVPVVLLILWDLSLRARLVVPLDVPRLLTSSILILKGIYMIAQPNRWSPH